MSLRYYILKDREPVRADLMTWAEWFEDFRHRVVQHDSVNGARVSTIFVGIDMNYAGNGPPLLFETAILGGEPRDCNITARCSTWEQALHQHRIALASLNDVASLDKEARRDRDRNTERQLLSVQPPKESQDEEGNKKGEDP